MDSIQIIGFSGTGNTRYVTDALIRSLASQGVEAEYHEMEKFMLLSKGERTQDAFLTGIAFPVHAFNAPPLVEKFIRQLPASQLPRKYFLIKTAGSPWAYGGSTSHLQKILARKNWHLQYEALVPMPSNFLMGYTEGFIKMNLLYLQRQVEKITYELIGGKRRKLPNDILLHSLSYLGRVEHMGAKIYGRYLKVESNCIQCGQCFRDCPTRNIKYEDGKFRFGWKCTLCMRCSFRCPVQAFSHKHLGKAVMLKPPYDLKRILADEAIHATDIRDNSLSYMKDLRNFYHREGLL